MIGRIELAGGHSQAEYAVMIWGRYGAIVRGSRNMESVPILNLIYRYAANTTWTTIKSGHTSNTIEKMLTA
ncbi:hypothetical protein FHV99_002658 [Ochrobactrum sp. P20RRXII]|nr:hypothetical protein [Ochrobactrum sp. P20RRXII]